MKKILSLVIVILFLFSMNASVQSHKLKTNYTDFDPLVDISVTVKIKAIRLLEEDLEASATNKIQTFLVNRIFKRAFFSVDEPSFYVKVIINQEKFISDVYSKDKYIYDLGWTAELNVPDDQEIVSIKIQLWDTTSGNNNGGSICDISPDTGSSEDAYDVEIDYNVKTGHWTGDDYLEDKSGYGRLCGTDDGSIYQIDKDCELWFDIYQNDFDSDDIPYWAEVNEFRTNPEVKDSGDPDNDDIPVSWEYNWGYDPFNFEDHEEIDSDGDSLNNYEEYLVSEWLSDPFRKDVFVELDIMEDGPDGQKVYFPENAKELITTAFNRQNVVFHLDMDEMGGLDKIPFKEIISHGDLNEIYQDYFMHGNDNSFWRRGIFRYGVVVYDVDGPPGYMFRSNAYQLASNGMEEKAKLPGFDRDIVYASGYMHELGHIFRFWPIPGHDPNSGYPWQLGYWKNRPYKSCMNYGWVYKLVDYSDGSRENPDIDDWARIDYSGFERD